MTIYKMYVGGLTEVSGRTTTRENVCSVSSESSAVAQDLEDVSGGDGLSGVGPMVSEV